eukprot:3890999-Rhodomonas_salina.2
MPFLVCKSGPELRCAPTRPRRQPHYQRRVSWVGRINSFSDPVTDPPPRFEPDRCRYHYEAAYELPGTERAYAATRWHTDSCNWYFKPSICYAMPGTEKSATRCAGTEMRREVRRIVYARNPIAPRLWYRSPRLYHPSGRGSYLLRAPYVMSGTGHSVWYSICLRAPYAMSGTDMPYADIARY